MAELTTAREFDLILDFAFGIAGRGIPVTVVSVGPAAPAGGIAHEELAERVSACTRSSDRIAPDGGDGWIALLIDCNRQGALVYADRVLERCGAWERENVGVTCGIATYAEGVETPEALVEAAISARRRAPADGGSRIGIHGE